MAADLQPDNPTINYNLGLLYMQRKDYERARIYAKKAYELWLIPMQGAPVPAGVFKPDVHGSAMVVNPPLPPGIEAKTFAITIEPEGGSQNPTMPIVMIGNGG